MKNLTLMRRIKLLSKEEMKELRKENRRKNSQKIKIVLVETEKVQKKSKRMRTNM